MVRDWCCSTPIDKPHFPGCSFGPEYQEKLRIMSERNVVPIKESDLLALTENMAAPMRELAQLFGLYENDRPEDEQIIARNKSAIEAYKDGWARCYAYYGLDKPTTMEQDSSARLADALSRVAELELQVGRLKEDAEANERRYQRGKEAERTLKAIESRLQLFKDQHAHHDPTFKVPHAHG